MDYRPAFNRKITEFKREELRKVLEQCTVVQQELFNRMYKNIEVIEDEKIVWAYQQVKSSLEDNQK